jgi:dethiobiotin synthetase
LVIGAWPAQPGLPEQGNRQALARLAPVRAVLPAGAGRASAEEFAALSTAAFDRSWVKGLN